MNESTQEEESPLHQPSAAFFDLPWPWPKSEEKVREVEFDREAHRAFLRGLG